MLRLTTALINPPAQVVVSNHFHERGSHALGMLTCAQYSFAAVGTMVVSGLPLTPSGNFMVSTCLFVACPWSAIGSPSRGRRPPSS
jgi:hypothetical protein